jgi:hypothetical protein
VARQARRAAIKLRRERARPTTGTRSKPHHSRVCDGLSMKERGSAIARGSTALGQD